MNFPFISILRSAFECQPDTFSFYINGPVYFRESMDAFFPSLFSGSFVCQRQSRL